MDEDDRVALAGTITQTNEDGRWVLVSDGTGAANVTAASSPAGDAPLAHPDSRCIEFDGRIETVPDGDDEGERTLQVSMYLGGLLSTPAETTD